MAHGETLITSSSQVSADGRPPSCDTLDLEMALKLERFTWILTFANQIDPKISLGGRGDLVSREISCIVAAA